MPVGVSKTIHVSYMDYRVYSADAFVYALQTRQGTAPGDGSQTEEILNLLYNNYTIQEKFTTTNGAIWVVLGSKIAEEIPNPEHPNNKGKN